MKATINLIIIIVSAAIMTLMTAGCSRKTVTATQTVTESTATQQTQTVTASTVNESRLHDFVLNIENTETVENLDSAGNSKGKTVKNTRTTVNGTDRTQTTANVTEDTVTESNDSTVTENHGKAGSMTSARSGVRHPPSTSGWWKWLIGAGVMCAASFVIYCIFRQKVKSS